MLSIYICEDDKRQRDFFEEYVEKAILMKECDMKLEYCTGDPYGLLTHISEKPGTGLYFLDIDLKCEDMNGMLLAREIRKRDPRGFIVFITTHSEMSFMVFEYGVEAMDYILKDFPHKIQNKIEENINRAYDRYLASKQAVNKKIVIKTKGRETVLLADEVIHIDSSVKSHKLEIFTRDGCISAYGSLKDILKELPEQFLRCHKSFIVNIDYVSEIDTVNKQITLSNGVICPASVQYMKVISKSIGR